MYNPGGKDAEKYHILMEDDKKKPECQIGDSPKKIFC